eukprot:TRINITY_DN754_c0_g1_i3.p1 TRINITY_DN754_c0_g1~~TRINITY_DN754_c0_g1_i3.p1  ORF type:complete len:482 (-),score=129.86 TRINITY_DN754_c0_g1_i3:18-1403(-)
MANGNAILQKALEYVNQAVEEDNKKNYQQAFDLYETALQYFVTALKYEKMPSSKAIITQKVKEYMKRAEILKEYLQKQNDKQNNHHTKDPAGSVMKQKSGKGDSKKDDDDDPEKTKLRSALEGAILKEKPNVKWDQVAGLAAAKEALKEAVIMPIKFPHLFTGNRRPWRGILLYGPPGTGKSYLAKAVATEASSTFFSVSSSDLVSKYLGESERLVRSLFEMAQENKPAIIFIDEIDSLCSARNDSESESARRIKTEFLVRMDGVGAATEGILVLAATNTPWALDIGIRRRFEKRIYIGLPDAQARARMIELHIGNTQHRLTPRDFKMLSEKTEGYSGSDISIVARDALMEPVRIVQKSTHFRKIRAPVDPEQQAQPQAPAQPQPQPNAQPQQFKEFYTPCSPGAAGAIEMSWMDIPGDQLLVTPVTVEHVLKAIHNNRASVNKADLELHEKFTTDYGQEG